jgi:LAO/AO transport system kinase
MNEEKLNKWLNNRHKRANLYDSEHLFNEILKGDIGALSRGITLIESANIRHKNEAKKLISMALPFSGKSFRIGISGVPGVGKSTFIESFGLNLIEKGKKVAVLAIDPSSSKNHGSILGDKTRMEQLSMNQSAYIRPSPAGTTLGGVARNTREAIYLCELAGFDVIIVETVGVGQSETSVNAMVDFFILLMLAGAGDELQGIKRGIMEIADLMVITKADGDNLLAAKKAKMSYQNALHLFPANENNWNCKVEICSALNNMNILTVLDICFEYYKQITENNYFTKNRKNQDLNWFNETLNYLIVNDVFENDLLKLEIIKQKELILNDQISSFEAAETIFNLYKNA